MPRPPVPEFAGYYEQTGGVEVWGECHTNGFFAVNDGAGGLVEVDASALGATYVQVCENGAISRNAGMAGTPFEIEPLPIGQFYRTSVDRHLGIDAAAPPDPSGLYVIATGHNVVGPFLQAFLDLGPAIVGNPISEPLQESPGSTVQYFQNLKLRVIDATGEVIVEQLGRDLLMRLCGQIEC